MGRIPINSCDFSPYTYNFDNVSDDFALEHFDESLKGDEDTGMIQLMHDALGKASLKLFGNLPLAWYGRTFSVQEAHGPHHTG